MNTDSECSVQNQERALSGAASALARLRRGYRKNRHHRKIKKLSGFLGHRERAWRGRKVVLADGRVAEVYGAVRGWVALVPRLDTLRHPSELIVRADELRLWKNPAAVLLGRAKAGVRERKSLRKTDAARLNGSRPPRPGSRPRGRPRGT